MSLVYYTVARRQYLFGHGLVPGGSRDTFAANTAARRVSGLAIAPDSEVRGVLVRTDTGETVRVIEGAPVRLSQPAGSLLTLDRHDYTDGRLVLMLAEEPEDMALLVGASVVLGYAAVRIEAEAVGAGHEVHIQRPRGALGWELAHGGYVYHSASGGMARDRRWLVDGQLVTSGLDSIDISGEFGDITTAATRVAVDTINTAADVVVTRVDEAGTLSLALRWAEAPAVESGGGEEPGMYALSDNYQPDGTLNGSADFGVLNGNGDEGAFGFLRVGNGPGPNAGDTVTTWGRLNLFNVDNGGTLSVSLPFLADISVAPDISVECDAAGCSITSASISMGAQLQLVVATPGADHFVGPVPVRVIYQAANAEDPE